MNTIVYFNEHMDRLTHQIYTKARYLKKSGMIFKVIMKNHQVHIVQSSTSENMVLIKELNQLDAFITTSKETTQISSEMRDINSSDITNAIGV